MSKNMIQLQEKIIQLLRENESMMRCDISRMLKIPRTTIYDNLMKLEKKNILRKFKYNNNERGRPVILWCLRDEQNE